MKNTAKQKETPQDIHPLPQSSSYQLSTTLKPGLVTATQLPNSMQGTA